MELLRVLLEKTNEDELYIAKIVNAIPLWKKTGHHINDKLVSQSLRISQGYASELLSRAIRKKQITPDDLEPEQYDPLYAILNDYHSAYNALIANKRLPKDKQHEIPKGSPVNISVRTGIPVHDIKHVIDTRWDEMVDTAKRLFNVDLKPGFFKENSLTKEKFSGNRTTDLDIAIVKAMGELTDNFSTAHYGKISSDAIARHLGDSELRRAIDARLALPEMRKYNNFRVRGVQ